MSVNQGQDHDPIKHALVFRYQARPSNPELLERFEGRPTGQSIEVTPTPAVRTRLLQQATPAYPDLARKLHASGQVKVQVYIDANGRPYKTAITERQPSFQRVFYDAARLAAMQSTYAPATNAQGLAVEDAVVMPFNFSLPAGTNPATCQLRAAASYPEAARRQGMETRLWLAVPVDHTGAIDAQRIAILQRGLPDTDLFDASARTAAAQAACTPAQSAGAPVDGWAFVEVDYLLAPEAKPGSALASATWSAVASAIKPGDKPEYPAQARRLGLQGRLIVQVVFDVASGLPLKTRIVHRSPHYVDVFDEAARHWAMVHRYQPDPERKTLNASLLRESTFSVRLPLNFVLDDGFKPASCTLKEAPAYPDEARSMDREARILVALPIDERGQPLRGRGQVVKRIPQDASEFDSSALAAAAEARCRAASQSSDRVRQIVLIEVPYRLKPDGQTAQ
ncbi:MAG: hypothetical protein E5299_02450 [Burkholderia gladioli]|nr:MAG: hypothetical protein E5299_02450 [Burkholderia gladioli]